MISDVYILILLFFLFLIFFLFLHLSIIFWLILKKKDFFYFLFQTSLQFCHAASFRTKLRCLLSYFYRTHIRSLDANILTFLYFLFLIFFLFLHLSIIFRLILKKEKKILDILAVLPCCKLQNQCLLSHFYSIHIKCVSN